jgi:non-specific serine/threonine protein kinase/serine/threonine-protein kinase
MNPELWQRVTHLLDEAIALNDSERSPYLDHACGADSELRREVESLLSSHQRAGTGFLKSPAITLQKNAQPAPLRAGRRIGAFQIIEEVGHGGMGEVFRAVRADGQYTKEVAIKLVRSGFGTAFVLERFRTERQILATLDHPNIARLLDGGTTEDGIPYLVMELIKGTRIDLFCDERKLSISQRLQLFLQVCAAVQYAHQRLVIHRDIKPGNILVTKEGVPQLLDFGIAKILDPATKTEVTMARPMTPEYASPEQIRGEPITTASDVYSLGVVLYQLLTGRSPYRAGADTPHQLSRAITETEPQRASMVVVQENTTLPVTGDTKASADILSAAREGSPAKLRRRLLGDLDNILLMALRKEPQRRYGSVQQFAEDICHHLEGLPVTAGKGSWRYRAKKFVSRNKVAVSAAAAVMLALLGGIVMTTRQARIARAERARAENHFNDIRKLANSLIFDVNDAMADSPGNTNVRRLLLDRAVLYLDKLAQDTGGNVDLQRELAWGYQRLALVQGNTLESNLGQVSAAEISNRKAMALFEAVAKANSNNTPDQLNLAMVHRFMGLSDIYYPGGRPEIDKAIAITDRLVQLDGANLNVKWERSLEYQLLGFSQDLAGDRAQSMESFRQCLTLEQDILRSNPDYPHVREGVAKTTIELGNQLAHAGLLDEAQRQADAGSAAYQTLAKQGKRPDVMRELAKSQQYLGQITLMRGDLGAAENYFNLAYQAIAGLARLDPENVQLQWDLVNLEFERGRLHVLSGRFDEAPAELQPALNMYDKKLEDDSGPGLGLLHAWLGEIQFAKHQYAEALRSYQKSAEVIEKDAQYDDVRCGIAADYVRMGDTHLKLNRWQDAAAAYNKALEKADLSFSLTHKDIPALYPIADAHAGIGDLSMALARKSRDPVERARYWNEGCASYQQSVDTWRQIPQPARFSPSHFPAGDPRSVNRRLAECRAKPQGATR